MASTLPSRSDPHIPRGTDVPPGALNISLLYPFAAHLWLGFEKQQVAGLFKGLYPLLGVPIADGNDVVAVSALSQAVSRLTEREGETETAQVYPLSDASESA